MSHILRIRTRAPLAWGALALLVTLSPLHAVPLQQAAAALREGKAETLTLAVEALKARPLAAPENLNMALALFWAGQFDDAARHLRRAMAGDTEILKDSPRLHELVPGATVASRLSEMAPQIETSAELCFLAGVLMYLSDDRERALVLLIRAEELAGSDAQAALLTARISASPMVDRSRERALVALRSGMFDDAARQFAFATMDSPTVAEHYAGAGVALSLAGEPALAERLCALALARARHDRLLAWLRDLRVPPNAAHAATLAAREPARRTATIPQLHATALIALAAHMYDTAREAALAVLLLDKLDTAAHELMRYLELQDLHGDPPGLAGAEPAPAAKTPEPGDSSAPAVPPGAADSVAAARAMIRRLEFSEALKLLEPLALPEEPALEVLLLVFVASVARDEPAQASNALQAWFARAPDASRTALDTLRGMFDRAEHFSQWRKHVLDLRAIDQNAPVPRLLNAFIEMNGGAYTAARQEVAVALIGTPGNEMLLAMQQILSREEFQKDAAARVIADKPTARMMLDTGNTLFRRGEYDAARSEFLAAQEASPREPRLADALVRVHFALGDYAKAARQVEAMLTEQSISERDATEFVLAVAAGYDQESEFEKHLAVLQLAAAERTSAADEYLLLGAIQFTRGRFTEAARALEEWQGLSRDRKLHPGLLKLLEAARKRA